MIDYLMSVLSKGDNKWHLMCLREHRGYSIGNGELSKLSYILFVREVGLWGINRVDLPSVVSYILL